MTLRFVKVILERFRKFTHSEFQFSESGLTLITGSNGSGKSTLIDAVYLLCFGRHPRDIPFASLIRRPVEVPYFSVRGELRGEFDKVRSVSYMSGATAVYHEGDAQVRRSDWIGHPPAVLFSPDELRLLTGEPARRRKYMDRILSMEKPEYMSRLRRYTRTLESRNALLKHESNFGGPGADQGEWLALDQTLSDDGTFILESRRRWIGEIKQDLSAALKSLGCGNLADSVIVDLAETSPGEMMSALIDRRAIDQSAGHTTIGPHRDDIRIQFFPAGESEQPVGAALALSQGEIRMVSLALKCLEANRISRTAQPVLLLDDIFSELDPKRQESVREFVASYPGQVILSSCRAVDGMFSSETKIEL